MKILLMLSLTYLVSCSTPQGPKDEDTRLVWGQEDKSIEDIFGNISEDDRYHNQHAIIMVLFGQIIIEVDCLLQIMIVKIISIVIIGT